MKCPKCGKDSVPSHLEMWEGVCGKCYSSKQTVRYISVHVGEAKPDGIIEAFYGQPSPGMDWTVHGWK